MLVHLGVDDIDSPRGGCTTHFIYRLLGKWLKDHRIKLIDYPNLIRLSPGVPWKTRGNGALVLRIDTIRDPKDLFEEALAYAEEYVAEYRHPESQPGIALYTGEINYVLESFSRKALSDIIPSTLLERILSKLGDKILYKRIAGGHRGLIGSLAGIGYRMINTDYTYELIAYRIEENYGKPRRVSKDSIKRMATVMKGKTFLNYDWETDKPLILPHGPDPVLLGIRGEEPEYVIEAYRMLEIEEPVEGAIVFRTNQHTDAHLLRINSLREAFIYRSIRVKVRVYSKPRRIRGGHVIFKVTDGENIVDVAAYEPTGGFRKIVEKLIPGDIVEVMGVVRPMSSSHGPTINLEKLHVIALAPRVKILNPRCPRCGSRLKSAGKDKGYKCPRCGFRAKDIPREIIYLDPPLEPGWYEPPPRAFKHLMKPIERFGREKNRFPRYFVPDKFYFKEYSLYSS